MTTPLQLDAYLLDAIEVEALEDFDQTRELIDLNMEVLPEHLTCDSDESAHQLVLTVRFGPNDEGSAPYRGRVVGRAFFRIEQELPIEERAQYVLGNGAAILFGLLRGQAAQITALARWGTFLLPPVNLVEAFASAGPKDELTE